VSPLPERFWTDDAWALADAVRAGSVRAVDVLDGVLDRIATVDPALNAVCFVDPTGARAAAEAIDDRVARGEDPGPLAGLPIGVKELTPVAGWPETHASLVYADRVAAHDDTETARLRAGGAVLAAQTTASEHGSVSFTNTPLHGVTRNPWSLAHTPGGSSGGAAAAVAAGIFPVATAGDGGGSIRIPAAYCGLVGMKVTYGLIGRGPGPFNSSLTPVRGPMARAPRDAARYLDVVTGPTLTDPTSLPKPAAFEPGLVSGAAQEGLRGLRVAWTDALGGFAAEPAVAAAAREVAEALVDAAGMEWVEAAVDFPRPGMSWGLLSSLDDMAWHMDAIADRLDDVTPVYRLAYESVRALRPEVVLKAIRRRAELCAASAALFDAVDLLLTPTTPTPAFAAEGLLTGMLNGEEVTLFGLSAAFTAPFNVTGQPACSIPAGTVAGLPVGLQVVAPRHHDGHCLAAGAVVEAVRPWPRLAPAYA
jgi:aspartyl-tRNA(Asn)/glutamyl-tRNA(Gln) amidotransferase subunit A